MTHRTRRDRIREKAEHLGLTINTSQGNWGYRCYLFTTIHGRQVMATGANEAELVLRGFELGCSQTRSIEGIRYEALVARLREAYGPDAIDAVGDIIKQEYEAIHGPTERYNGPKP